MKTFGDFEFDEHRRSLRAQGRPVKISGQALEFLSVLLERPGELISREEIERRLWSDTNVNFDHSLDVIVSRLRTVLGDRYPNPRYIETVPRRGYRFIEPVIETGEARPRNAAPHWTRRVVRYAAVALLAAILAIVFARSRYDKVVSPQRSHASATASDR